MLKIFIQFSYSIYVFLQKFHDFVSHKISRNHFCVATTLLYSHVVVGERGRHEGGNEAHGKNFVILFLQKISRNQFCDNCTPLS
jgi:hypothetical protein